MKAGITAPIATGVIAAAVSSWFAIAIVLRYVKTHSYGVFALYRVLLGGGGRRDFGSARAGDLEGARVRRHARRPSLKARLAGPRIDIYDSIASTMDAAHAAEAGRAPAGTASC